jgi:hypothetical protein
MSNSNRTPERATAFCAALAETCNVGKACKAIGMGRQTAYDWREDDPEFKVQWDRAMRVGVSALEDEAHRRGFEGVAEPLTHQGQFTYELEEDRTPTGKVKRRKGEVVMRRVLGADGKPKVATIQKYSDTLAIFLLKAHDPDKYRDNSKVVLDGGLNLTNMTVDQIEQELADLAVLQAARGAPPGA